MLYNRYRIKSKQSVAVRSEYGAHTHTQHAVSYTHLLLSQMCPLFQSFRHSFVGSLSLAIVNNLTICLRFSPDSPEYKFVSVIMYWISGDRKFFSCWQRCVTVTTIYCSYFLYLTDVLNIVIIICIHAKFEASCPDFYEKTQKRINCFLSKLFLPIVYM